jgi:hypothetical protein
VEVAERAGTSGERAFTLDPGREDRDPVEGFGVWDLTGPMGTTVEEYEEYEEYALLDSFGRRKFGCRVWNVG